MFTGYDEAECGVELESSLGSNIVLDMVKRSLFSCWTCKKSNSKRNIEAVTKRYTTYTYIQ